MSGKNLSKGKKNKKEINKGWNLSKIQNPQEKRKRKSKRFFRLLGTKLVLRKRNKEDLTIDKVHRFRTSAMEIEEKRTEVHLGKVWVKDGQIYCKESSAHFPTITVSEGMHLYKNGKLVKKTTVLSEKDQIRVDFPNERKEASWSIQLHPSKMEAILNVEMGYQKVHQLKDQEPSAHLDLQIETKLKMINPLQATHLEQRMKELGINTGIQPQEIQRALNATESGQFIIAKGLEPIQGKDGWVEWASEFFDSSHLRSKEENGIQPLTSQNFVQSGQLIGTIHPPVPGKAGYSVTGESIPANSTKAIQLQLGKGTDLLEKGSKIVALLPGRVSIQQSEEKLAVCVIPRYYQSGHLYNRAGQIQFYGDVEIKGDVDEKAVVEAMHDIVVHGMVNESKITAGNHIIVCKNVLNGRLSAGKEFTSVMELGMILSQVSSQLHDLASAVVQVFQSPLFKKSDMGKMGIRSLIRLLLQKKFQQLPSLIKKLEKWIVMNEHRHMVEPELKEIHSELVDAFFNLESSPLKDVADIESIKDRMEKIRVYYSFSESNNAKIIIPYALNSEIICSGDVSIIGKGSLDTKIFSEGRVEIKGVLCGGNVYAAKGVVVEETWIRGKEKTKISVPLGQSIKINHAQGGTIIQIGSQMYRLENEKKNVHAVLSKEGTFQFL
ncbi:FapA family protein [Neobacillus thermocopriae]|uniref:DUF342 domain-containing protein n=1 Tax=Neobacillus thermocopriae TaxID=1215031 RepID=A0A6B3TRL2_9BACI|nr:FapA family protein [Neobacillus thermocopriae]NEX79654.1 DUF342 domain-containing protein [Neobacillus thermocopriae]